MARNGTGNGSAPAVNGQAYALTDHTYDVIVVGAGGAGLRATLGASQAVLLFEGAIYRVHKFEDQAELRYNGPGTYVSGNAQLADLAHPGKPFETADHFPDRNSWGYRLAGRLDYSNLIGAINVFPRFSWQHDVRGISPGPGGPFLEGRKALTLGVNFNYLDAWEADVSFTTFHGAGRYNLVTDRDFLAATLKYRF